MWVHGSVAETSSSGISSDPLHFVHRGLCLDELQRLHGTIHPALGVPDAWLMNSTSHTSRADAGAGVFVSSVEPYWVTGYQKYVYISVFDAWTLMWDPK